jgi:hypothetical protein
VERSKFRTVRRRWSVHPQTETVSDMALREPTCDKRVSVLTAQQKQDATRDSTDAC